MLRLPLDFNYVSQLLTWHVGFKWLFAILYCTTLTLWLGIQPIGLIFIVLFCNFYNNCNNMDTPAAPEEKSCLQLLKERIKYLNTNYPQRFRVAAAGVLTSIAALEITQPNITTLLIHALVAYCILKKVFGWTNESNRPLATNEENELSEFIPETNETNMRVLETTATEDSDSKEDKSDEESSEPEYMLEKAPEMNDLYYDSTEDEEDKMLPTFYMKPLPTVTPNPSDTLVTSYSRNWIPDVSEPIFHVDSHSSSDDLSEFEIIDIEDLRA